jgi:hypothetical protein
MFADNFLGGKVTSMIVLLPFHRTTLGEETMARDKYYVVLHDGEWKIKYGGKHYGPYRTQNDAINAARDAALKVYDKGGTSQVLIQGKDNKFRTEWTYGDDPYPPSG